MTEDDANQDDGHIDSAPEDDGAEDIIVISDSEEDWAVKPYMPTVP